LLQLGFWLRDVRAVHRLCLPDGWIRSRGQPTAPWHRQRDDAFRELYGQREIRPEEVCDVPRMGDETYDDMLTRTVVLTHAVGAAANNVIVECAARCTPVVANRLASVEWYLGKDYPLFYDQLDDVAGLLSDRSRLLAASQYLASMDRDWLSVSRFVDQIEAFVGSLKP
jgi:hypothetical protein